MRIFIFSIFFILLIATLFAPSASEGGPSPQPLTINYFTANGSSSDLINLICPGNLLEFNISSKDKPVSEVEIRMILYEPYQGFKQSQLTDGKGSAVFNMTNERDGKYQIDISKNGYVKPEDVFFTFKHCAIEPTPKVEPLPLPTPQPLSIPSASPEPQPKSIPEPASAPPQPPELSIVLELTSPGKIEVGKEFSAKATKDGKPCTSCTIVIRYSDGKEISKLTTDSNGEIKVSLPNKGDYELQLLTDQGLVAKKTTVIAEVAVDTSALDKKETGFLDDPSVKTGLVGIITIFVVLILIYLWWRRKSDKG